MHFIRDVEGVVPNVAGWRRERTPQMPEDMDIPNCVDNTDEAIALIREHHAKGLAVRALPHDQAIVATHRGTNGVCANGSDIAGRTRYAPGR